MGVRFGRAESKTGSGEGVTDITKWKGGRLILCHHACILSTGQGSTFRHSESTHSIDPAMATVEGSLPGLGERTVYFFLCASIPVLDDPSCQRP